MTPPAPKTTPRSGPRPQRQRARTATNRRYPPNAKQTGQQTPHTSID